MTQFDFERFKLSTTSILQHCVEILSYLSCICMAVGTLVVNGDTEMIGSASCCQQLIKTEMVSPCNMELHQG